MGRLVPILFLLAAAPAPSLQDVERQRAAEQAAQQEAAARAAAAQAEAERLAAQRQDTLARLRAAEAESESAAQRVAELSARQRDAQARLDARMQEIGPLLPLIERLSLYPSETLLAVPLPPEQAVRGVLVMRGIARQLEQAVAAVKAEQAELARLQKQFAQDMPVLAAASARQAALAGTLDQQIRAAQERRESAEDAADAAAKRAAAAAAQAADIRAAIAKLETERRAAEAKARQAAARARQPEPPDPVGKGPGSPSGQWPAPLPGPVARGFGEATAAGPASGLTWQVSGAERVVAPCGGRVVFGAPFRSFGLLLILDCGGGYHFVLSGFERLDVRVGQSVASGDPVGVMPGWDPRGTGARPSLYVELRRNGQPVNPAPFLRAKG